MSHIFFNYLATLIDKASCKYYTFMSIDRNFAGFRMVGTVQKQSLALALRGFPSLLQQQSPHRGKRATHLLVDAMVSLSSKEQARLCGVDLDVELELQKRWGAGPEEEETCSSEEHENTTIGDVVPSSASSTHDSRVIFLDDERELEQRYGQEIVNGDNGYFLPRSWVFAHNTEILFEPEAVSTCLHTFARNGEGESICHDKHPFATIVHLLRNADDNSCVYISVPYLSDLHFVDELCHYAKSVEDGGKNLSIRVVLGPEQWVKD